ncbi:MAG: hypothetical protein JWQ81_4984 [Amycolatopsis sp.]|jgi:hypothetical protein|nr:hypothetical protein [Amycolatopsis sp.]
MTGTAGLLAENERINLTTTVNCPVTQSKKAATLVGPFRVNPGTRNGHYIVAS